MFGGTCTVFPRHPQKLEGVSVEGWAILREPMRAERERKRERNSLCRDSDLSFPLRLVWPRKHTLYK